MDYQTYIFATDPHLTNKWPESRKDNFLQAIFNKLEWLVDTANNRGAMLLFGGDWVDRYNSKPEIINTLISILRRAKKPIYSVIGNHDVYGHNHTVINNVILGSLFASGLINLLTSEPIFVVENGVTTQLTGFNYLPEMEKNKAIYFVNKCDPADQAIHVVHGFLVNKHWATLKKDSYSLVTEIVTEADVVCTGHEHQGFGVEVFDNVIFTNPGALGRISSNAREIARMPQATLIKVYKDRCTASLLNVPASPGGQVLSREKIDEERARSHMLVEFKENLLDTARPIALVSDIFEAQAKLLKIPADVKRVSEEALEEYEKRSIVK